ncbi:NADH-quinone oxidoreductase subunit L [Phycicoccus sp. BSK3Z-2]|uniref:NADH-quinone oxidoreductase subunit L n=1 Tax=Phycicoccus avicenniae TaxID=2828860 RepID=A0A941D6Y6_9MICO|nr:proton-conducting transporter membrane subunit [Phycicoccus avicenniae]MBR7743244.1 NADH-quinone oxidoreductase subunit L [Phycicoccus avicenniae]
MTPWLVVGLPVVASVVGLAVRRDDRIARVVAVGAGAAALFVALLGWLVADDRAMLVAGPGLRAGELDVPLDLVVDPPRAAVAAVVALVALAVQVYSTWYLAADDRYGTFAATVSLFTGAMLLVVHSADLLLTVVGWEVMGWCSYLLVGHWSRRASARRAALKAFLVTRVADVAFVLGLVGLAAGAGSTSLGLVLDAWARPTECIDAETAAGSSLGGALTLCDAPDARVRAVLLVLVVVGVLGKSAQVPFQDWLPDAMEGPTPASALIHAATMVAAGTVVLAGLFPVLAESPTARWVLGVSVSVTMLLAAVLAFAQSDLKRMLAWSTVSQVAVMLAALAGSPLDAGPDGGLLHLWSHALFKALLFLALGWAALAAGGTAVAALRGSAADAPLLRLAVAAGFLSLAGVPLVVGGVSKEHVLATVWDGAVAADGPGVLVLVALVVTSSVTAAYSTRGYLLLTAHTRGGPEPVTPPAAVRAVLGTLLVLTVLGGLVVLTGTFAVHSVSLLWLLLTAVVVAVGVAVALRGGFDRDPAEVLARRFVPVADRGLGVDLLYRRLVARPVLRLARLVAFVDTEVIDAYVRGTVVGTRAAGWAGQRLHRAERPGAGVGLVLGAVVVLAALALLAATGVLRWS